MKLASEAGLTFTCFTRGEEYHRPDLFKSQSGKLIVPLNFPAPPAVKDPAEAAAVPLSQLRRWEQAPTNPAVLHEHGIDFAFTLQGLKDPGTFWKNLRKAIAHGLPADKALAALTTQPAQMIGQEKTLGRLEPGYRADFLVAGANLFQDLDPVILQVWVAGKPYQHKLAPSRDLRGTYVLSGLGAPMDLLLKGSRWAPEAAVLSGKDTLKADFSMVQDRVLITWQMKAAPKGSYALNGNVTPMALMGSGTGPDGHRFDWQAKMVDAWHKADTLKPIKPVRRDSLAPVTFPNMAYGFRQLPTQGTFLIKGATVWTNTDKGILQKSDVLVRNGKIAKVGKDLSAGEATVIEGAGMHLTPGIIDEHSHIAISNGVNEGSHAVTAEVSIADVIDSDDINIYRQLSGGVVAAQLLHGSANPIGGQSGVIKLRWGMTPEEMKLAAAPGRIKFALGENVKQSNWGDLNTIRYPQTRMGVEQLFRDAFRSALDYREQWKKWSSGGDKSGMTPPRKDLQMEVLLEILDGKRLISCHSYQQGEILMLIRVADSFKFKVNTFTHVLEGYKIAREIQQHGATASTFSDWWAYKYEVIDAVPQNAAIMTSRGVNVCINSDDVEMGRRLNQEAAKSVLYAGMSEEEALKMVTLNPAKALKVDGQMGSIREGMDADIVLWSAHPLSVYAQAQKTWVDGRLLFDRSQQPALLAEIAAERNRIIQKILTSGEAAGGSEAPKGPKLEYECETIESEYNRGSGN
jgi:imidazolonepropionase-like amidohydrolase